ncbi:Oxysterol-binding family protein [Candida albicans]|uniref:Oxysterol-binding family protein n=1 Tax=Candida albicans TaxID=5476 RepID=A0A8H6F6B6_CANAX|nr:Oxysterol-binding family protein [Candida albicans]
METLEVHSKDFLIKWINAPDNSIIDWEAKPLKKSINFSFYKKKEESLNQSETSLLDTNSTAALEPPTAIAPPPQRTRSRSASTASVNQFTKSNDVYRSKSRASTLLSINESDLILIKNYNKLVANELIHGKFEVEKGGMFAFVFDNSFSKTIAKSVQFSAKIVSKSKSEEHIAQQKVVAEVHDQHLFDENDVAPGETLQSIMLKKRRKKLQGFTKRYFVLNFGRETLSYFKVDDNKLRGQMPVKDCIVSANPSSREFIIDSGMEVWHLKAINKADFNAWVNAFNTVKKEETVVPTSTTEESDSKEPVIASTPLGASNSELQLIAQKLAQLKTENPSPLANEIHQDFLNLLTRAKGQSSSSPGSADVQSVFSSDFHDAVDHFDETGVYFLDDEGKIQEDEEVADDGESSSEEEEEEDEEFVQVAPSGVHADQGIVQDKELPQPTVEADDDNLYPLPHDPVSRSSDIPICTHTPPSILSFVRKNVGKDLSTIAMPVTYNEPTTVLQKFAEMLEYPEVATNALISDFQDESGEKLLRVAAFALSYLSTQRAKERNKRKPFTPLLGETYELVREDLGFRLISEKVSHRPPVFAYHIDTEHWTLDYALSPGQKFWGKQSEVTTKGTVYLKDKSTGEVFTWTQPTTMIKNIIAGETYAEPTGSVTIKSSNGYKAVAEFAKGGMWSGRSEGVIVKAFDNRKKELTYSVEGNWTESFTLKTKSTEKTIWQAGELLPQYQKKFGFTEFAETLKNKLEQDQRDRRKQLETAGEKSYWNRRKKGDWDDLIKLW